MKRMHLYLSICALWAPLSASAAGGAFEINQDCAAVGCFAGDAAGFPITINQRGTYMLTSDLVVNTAADGIDVQADRIDLDLNGHTLDGGGTCTGTPASACSGAVGSTGIYLAASSASGRIRIHNGVVRGFGNFGMTGGDLGDGIVLDRLTIAENSGYGINLVSNTYGGIVQVRDSSFVRNFPNGFGSSLGVDIEHCTFSGSQSDGLVLSGGGSVANSRFVNNLGFGIYSVANKPVALDRNVFNYNNAGAAQWSIGGTLRDMGGNVCTDHACP